MKVLVEKWFHFSHAPCSNLTTALLLNLAEYRQENHCYQWTRPRVGWYLLIGVSSPDVSICLDSTVSLKKLCTYLICRKIVLFYSLLLTCRGWSKRKSGAGGGGGFGRRSHRPSGEDPVRSCGSWTLRQRQSPGPGISSRYACILLLSFLRISKCCMYNKRPYFHNQF